MFNKIVAIFLFITFSIGSAYAQSNPGLTYGQVPSAAQWNSYFSAKQDYLGYTPLSNTNGVMLGELTTAASTTASAGFNFTPGVAPTTPNNGDAWVTASGFFVQVGGNTIQVASSGGSFLNANNTWSGTNTWTSVATFQNFAYFPANLQSAPTVATGGLAISYNQNLTNEVDFWNTVVSPNPSFLFKQMTGTGTFKNLFSLLAGGGANFFGSTSGQITFGLQAAAGTYNFNLPTTAGSSGQVLTSAGGGTAAMTWSNAGTGTVTSAQVAAGAGLAATGTCTITTSGVCTIQDMKVPQGRLTLTVNTPVMTATALSSQVVYYAPYTGNTVPIYNGTNTQSYQFTSSVTDTTGLTLTLGASANWVANTLYDLFVTLNTGSPVLCTGPAWSSATARAAGGNLTLYNGYLVNGNASSITCRTGAATTISVAQYQATYVGTMATDASNAGEVSFVVGGSASGGTAGVLNLYNYYNRVNVIANVIDSGATYTYATNTVRAARASATNRITFVSGIAEEPINATYFSQVSTLGSAGAQGAWGVGLDTTTTFTGAQADGFSQTTTATPAYGTTHTDIGPQIGQHFISANEISDGTNSNTFDLGSQNRLSAVFRM